jgi:DNA-binding response OmpR family regulator
MVDAISELSGLRVLVVEDEYMVADDICTTLEDFGCHVVGPVGRIDKALDLVRKGNLDGALLDANLNGESSAPIAVALGEASVPFAVVTGYGALALVSEALNSAPRLSKPWGEHELKATMMATFRHSGAD